jgi:hypothetical protein
MSAYTDRVIANVAFLGDRARELADQEVDRARSLDTKAGAIVAASVALVGASVAFVTRLADLDGGTGAKTLWAVELFSVLVGLLAAGSFAVWALVPRVIRSTVAFHEIETWETPRALEADLTFNQGKLLRAAVHSVGLSRSANKLKAERLRWASWVFAGALISISVLTISVAVHAAAYPDESTGSISNGKSKLHRSRQDAGRGGARRARRAYVSPSGLRYGASRGTR